MDKKIFSFLIGLGFFLLTVKPIFAQVTAASDTRQVDIPDISELRQGIPQGADNPALEVFVFADFTEGTFSAPVLLENIPALLAAYPNDIRVYYLHTVLPYRSQGINASIGDVICMPKQGHFWDNMAELVRVDGYLNGNYKLTDPTEFGDCQRSVVNSGNQIPDFISQSQRRLAKYQGGGIPTAIFVKREDPKHGRIIIGKVPPKNYMDLAGQMLGQITPTPTSGPTIFKVSPTPTLSAPYILPEGQVVNQTPPAVRFGDQIKIFANSFWQWLVTRIK